MQLKLTLVRPGGGPEDVAIDTDAQATVGQIARALAERNPRRGGRRVPEALTLRVDGPGPQRVLAPDRTLQAAALRSGDTIAIVATDGGRFVDAHDERAAAATLVIESGPGQGSRLHLAGGANDIGRGAGCTVRLDDPLVSKRHARFNVTDVVEVIDLGSANGVYVNGDLVQRAVVRPGESVLLGDTTLVVEQHKMAAAVDAGNTIAFNRPPYLDPRYPGERIKAPEPPRPPQLPPLPYLSMAAPLLMGVALYFLTKEILGVIFIGLSPLILLAMWIEQRRAEKKRHRLAVAAFRERLAALAERLDAKRAEERASRRREHPAAPTVIEAGLTRSPLLWARRPDRPGFGELRTGTATLPSRTVVELPDPTDLVPELYDELVAVVEARREVADVPLVASLAEVGVVGVAGPPVVALAAMRSLLAQVIGLHSPAELTLAALLPSESADQWEWLKWLPHVDDTHNPLGGRTLGVGGAAAAAVASRLADLVEQREIAARTPGRTATNLPVVVVLVDDDAPVERRLLVDLAERGPAVGIHPLWLAGATERLPARAEVFVAVDPRSGAADVGIIAGGVQVMPVDPEAVPLESLERLARSLAPVVDAGAGRDEEGELPSRVSFLDRVGLDLVGSPTGVVERWRASDSLPGVRTGRRRSQPLHAVVGVTPHENMSIDLRAQGPHALVGGTTGAGKSEFLQSWIMGLAVNHSPARVTFLFVDYKGGSAFSACTRLPHTVGLVTDLTPHLVTRALRSLNAELRHREHILNRKRAKDILELEQRGDPDCPPSLIIVVDEFAALVAEVPEFVDGVVNVAQRGRSLGLHLILATQRPAGVIRDNLRANTNLRVALRMADEADSDDVVGTTMAAGFDPSLPGRAVLKAGPGRLTTFQSAYVGGWTTDEAPPPPITIRELRLATPAGAEGGVWAEPPPEVEPVDVDPGPTDIVRLVDATRAASSAAAVPEPRKPWLPELAPVYDLARIPQSRTDRELVFAVMDDPDEQRQVPVAFHPDVDGNMAVIGTGGSGKTTFLRTLAVAAGLSLRGGPCHVYGLDFASRGLQLLEPLPHVGSVVNGDDDERVDRLIRYLREVVDERARRYAAVRAGTVEEYRQLAGQPDEPRILLLVDGLATFRQEYEVGPKLRVFDRFAGLATDGRPVGVHVVVTADRAGSVPSSLGSMIQRRLTLRLASENDYAMAGIRGDALAEAPPGRGFLDGFEAQVAVLGGSTTTAGQSAAIAALATRLAETVGRAPAPAIGRLPERVDLGDLPVLDGNGNLTVGVADLDLGPFGIALDDPFVIAGPPRSGKTTAMATIAAALRRRPQPPELVYVGEGRSALSSTVPFDLVLHLDDDLEDRLIDLAERLADERAAGCIAVFLDDAPRLSALPEDDRLADVVKAAGRTGQIVVADGETSALSGGSWGVLQVLKLARHGLALVPDQFDGDAVFKTPFPPVRTLDYPPGRGIHVRAGRLARVQFAVGGVAG